MYDDQTVVICNWCDFIWDFCRALLTGMKVSLEMVYGWSVSRTPTEFITSSFYPVAHFRVSGSRSRNLLYTV